MKNINLFTIILLVFQSALGFSQNWIWAKQIGGSLEETCGSHSICRDSDGNIYITGVYYSNPCYFSNDTLMSMTGASDFYIAKYNAAGNELWVKGLGSINSMNEIDAISNIVFNDFTNSLFVNGEFYETCILGSDTLESRGSSDAFLARLDLDGNFIWAKQIGGIGEDLANGLAVNVDGTIYTSSSLIAGGEIDTFYLLQGVNFIKLDSDGNFIWAEKKFNYHNGIFIPYEADVFSINIIDNLIFGIGECSVDSFDVDTVTVQTNLPHWQNIIFCMDTNHATVRWMKCFGSAPPQPMYISTDNLKNNFITGGISGEAIFDDDTLYSPNNSELIFAKYDSLGNKIWAKKANSSSGAFGNCVVTDYEGGAYFTGGISGTVTIDSFTLNTSVNGDVFISRFSSNGTCLGLKNVAGGFGSAMLVSDDNKLFINGKFTNTITFGSNPTLTSYGSSDVFLAKCDAITGVGEELRLANNQLLIYANPTKGICNVTIPDEFKHEHTLNLQVFDLAGKLLQESTLEMQGSEIKINLEQEAKGIYNINLSNRNKTYRGKVVFE